MSAQTVSMRALISRINRKLGDYQMLRTTRGNRWVSDLGNYYVVDLYSNVIESPHVDPVQMARAMGVLLPGETVTTSAISSAPVA